MRNLLGRLHARPPADLDRIAAFWRVPLGSGDRHGRVGALYRVMIDPVAARDVWARLAQNEAAMLRLLATGETREDSLTLAEVAAGLGVAEAEARETALRLYRVGLLAREGDADELPSGKRRGSSCRENSRCSSAASWTRSTSATAREPR
jgi:hypothetical protein